MAVTVGFEPTVQGYYTRLFESRTFGRSDTPPGTSLNEAFPLRKFSELSALMGDDFIPGEVSGGAIGQV